MRLGTSRIASRLAVAAAFLSTSAAQSTAPFLELTDMQSEFANFNIETVRGMCTVPGGNGIYALNTHGSMLVWHQDLSLAPEASWHTVQNPVALAPWNNTILVVGGATHALVQHDRFTGAVLNSVRLPSEPADIVVDTNSASHTNNSAFIACQGANAVVRVDLSTFTVANTYTIASQRPRYLFLEHASAQAHVYVTPLLSGNNTIPVPPLDAQFNPGGARAIIKDLTGLQAGLPDEDLYRIAITNPSGAATVTPVLRGAGTLLTRHGRNPNNGNYWVLSVDSLNAQSNSTEASIRGAFAESQLAIATTLGQGVQPVVRDLDRIADGDPYSSAVSMSFPVALVFRPSGGQPNGYFAVVASSTNDRLTVLDPAGVRVRDVWLPAGSIPRDLMFDPSGTILTVYAWGTNKLLLYDFNNLPLPPSTAVPFMLDLGHDPTPDSIRAGRTIWYDAERSLHARTTCNTCHPGGKFDGLGWGISDDPSDRKDIMVTQSVLSLADTPKYHWRGEREDLRQFNGAFARLLGGASVLNTIELDQLESFILSLQASANPREHDARIVDNNSAVVVGEQGHTSMAVQGQMEFHTVPALVGNTCVSCHNARTGTDGSLSADAETILTIPSSLSFDVPHLRELFHKDQTPYSLNFTGFPARTVARNGFGLLHDGLEVSALEFVEPQASGGPFTISFPQQANIVSFVLQFDAGIAPAAHISQFIDATHASAAALAVVTNLLVPQAQNGWIDLAVLERSSGANFRWLYDVANSVFVRNVGTPPPTMPPSQLLTQAQQTGNSCLFLGLPPANGRRFALDPDFDQLTDDREAAHSSNSYVADTDIDSFPDGYEVDNGGNPTNALVVPNDSTSPVVVSAVLDHAGAAYAKYFVEFSEPVVYEVAASANGVANAPVHTMKSVVWQKKATVVVQSLENSTPGTIVPSTNTFTPSLTFADRAGHVANALLPTATVDTHVVGNNGRLHPESLVDSIQFNGPLTRAGTTLSGTVDVRIRNKANYPAPSGIPPFGFVVLQVLVEKLPVATPGVKKDWVVSDTGSNVLTSLQKTQSVDMQLNASTPKVPYTQITGALLVRKVDATGLARFDFSQAGLTAGQGVRFNVVAILDPSAAAPNPPPPQPPLAPFHPLSVLNYQVADTPPDKRLLETTF